jgi:hypothetical protein
MSPAFCVSEKIDYSIPREETISPSPGMKSSVE